MAATAALQLEGKISGLSSGVRNIGPITLASANASGHSIDLVLQNGDNTITLPATPAPKGCIVQLPATNTAVTKIKGAGGDTGVDIGKTGVTVLSFDPTAPPASFILNSAATQTGKVTSITFF